MARVKCTNSQGVDNREPQGNDTIAMKRVSQKAGKVPFDTVLHNGR